MLFQRQLTHITRTLRSQVVLQTSVIAFITSRTALLFFQTIPNIFGAAEISATWLMSRATPMGQNVGALCSESTPLTKAITGHGGNTVI